MITASRVALGFTKACLVGLTWVSLSGSVWAQTPIDTLYVVNGESVSDSIRKFDGSTGALLGTFAGNGGGHAFGLACTTNGILVSKQFSNQIQEFDNSTGAFRRVFAAANLNGPTGIAVGPNHNVFVGGYYDFDVVELDGVSGSYVRTLASNLPGSVFSMAFGPNGNLFAAVDDLGYGDDPGTSAVELDPSTGAVIGTYVGRKGGRGLTIYNGRLYVSIVANDPQLTLIEEFDLATRALLRTLAPGTCSPHGLAIGPNGNLFVSAASCNRIEEVNLGTGAIVRSAVTSGLEEPIELRFGSSAGPCAVPPSAQIQNLISSTLITNLSNNIQSQLDSKLSAAIATLDAAKQNSAVTAANQLQAFVNAIKADVQGGKLTCAQATPLVAAAQQIVAALGQPPLAASLLCQ